MLWYEVLAPVLILAGAAFFGWMLYCLLYTSDAADE